MRFYIVCHFPDRRSREQTDLSSFVDKRSGYEFPYVCVLVLVVSIQFITLRRSPVNDHVDTL